MFDGINLSAIIPDVTNWLARLDALPDAPRFYTPTDTGSGEVKARRYDTHTTTERRATVGQYKATLKEKESPGGSKETFLRIKGSLHKNHYGGTNWQPFPLDALHEEIKWIESHFLLSAEAFEIRTLEFGVNLAVSFDVSGFIARQALLSGTREMIPYQPATGVSLGRYCPGAEKAVKLYDKGLQNALPAPLMRFELRYTRMRYLKALGIFHLSDLLNPHLPPALLTLLLQDWDKMLIGYPFPETDLQDLPAKDAALLGKGYCRDFWRELHSTGGSDAFTNTRKKYRQLLERQGIGIQAEIKELIGKEWQRLAGSEKVGFYGKSPVGVSTDATAPAAPENAVLRKIPIKIKGDFPLGCFESQRPGSAGKMFQHVSTDKPTRRCLSCGSDISQQSGKSVFCSAKYVGEQQAHRCRNAMHNRRRDMRNRETRYRDGLLFDPELLLLMPVYRLTAGRRDYQQRKVFAAYTPI